MVSPDQRSSMQHMLGMLNSIFTPVCPVASTDVPSTIFSSDTNKVYTLFCAGWQSGTASSLTVDAAGNKRVPQPQSKRKRTPPANTANYVNWNFDLSFTPAVGGPTCSTDCTGAYAKIASACTSNSGGSYIYESASINVGCGTFASKVYNPTTALTTGPQFCYQKTDFAPLNNDGVNERTLTINAGVACAGSGVNMIKKDQNSTFRNWMTYGNGAPYQVGSFHQALCSSRPGRKRTDDLLASTTFGGNPVAYLRTREQRSPPPRYMLRIRSWLLIQVMQLVHSHSSIIGKIVIMEVLAGMCRWGVSSTSSRLTRTRECSEELRIYRDEYEWEMRVW